MIDLYYAPGPNPRKVSIMLEECGLAYNAIPMNLMRGDQFDPAFLCISPNNRIPAIVDSQGPDGEPIAIFESGAILLYLAKKAGRFGGGSEREHIEIQSWLFWQVGGLGPMGGQLSHFVNHAKEGNDYARARYGREYERLLGVMEIQLAERDYLAGEYSIADMASFPWLLPYRVFGVSLDPFPRVRRWFDSIKARPAVRRAVALGLDWNMEPAEMTEAERKLSFEQSAAFIAAARDASGS
ncbi:MAG: glutathione S-transferase N-terminal domain-containing protein [Porticoccaceae bacterium]